MSVTQPGPGDSTLAATFDAARLELKADVLRGAGGRAALERYSDRVDALLRQLLTEAGGAEQPVAIVALGGYGRRHLCVHSDIDLLVLFGGSIGAAEERFLRAFLHPLWDLGVVIGHQVRELDDFARLETDNPEFLLALLDARPVAGARPLFDRFGVLFHTPATHAFILTSLLQLIEERHARFNGTLYQLEPDVKEAPGALRDLAATRTIAMLTDPLLLRRGPADAARVDEAEDFLLRVRSTLHLEAGRNQNVLSHEMQERTADLLGYPGAEPRPARRAADERLLPPRADRRALARLGAAQRAGAGRTEPRPVARRHPLPRSAAGGAPPGVVARRVPRALEHGATVAEEALSCIQQHVDRYRADDFFPEAADRAALLAFLKPRPGLYARLSEMHDCGLLGRVFPEFQAISWRVVRDFYHKYTVDEHTLLTIRNLERLSTTEEPYRRRFRNVAGELAHPELLVLALLLHDVGKWRDDDHAIESERMAREVVDRLQLAGEAARHGAVPDPPPPPHVAGRLPPRHRGPGDRQGVRGLHRHRRAPEDALPDDAGRRRGGQPGDADAVEGRAAVAALRRHLQSPDAALRRRADRAQPGRARRAAARSGPRTCRPPRSRGSSRGCRSATCSCSRARRSTGTCGWRATSIPTRCTCRSSARRPGVWTLAVATLDKPFLFSNICGVLSSFGMNIIRGHALTNPNGLVLDVFQFTDDERFLELNADGHGRLLHTLEDVVAGARGRRRPAARPRAGRAAVEGGAALSRRSCAPTTTRPAATPSSTSSPATSSGCSTASAA